MKNIFQIAALTACGLAAPLAAMAADDDGPKFSFSGFAQLTAGKVLSGKEGSYMQWSCPCTIQNWEYVGVYEKSKGWQADQESLLGLQGTLRMNDKLSATVQLLSRPNNDNYQPSVDWAYVSYALTDEWTLQAGRKRIPLYYYSDFLYVGTAYPWVRPAPDVYGWPIYAYDGANLAYSRPVFGNWTLDANLWAGGFSYKDNAYDTKIYFGDRTDEAWRKILGGYATLSDGAISVRAMLMTFRNEQSTHKPDGSTVINLDGYRTNIMGLSANYDGRNWILRSELNRFSQKVSGYTYNYFLLGGGYKFGDWTGMYTISRYRTAENNFLAPIEGRRTKTLALRWDVSKNWALKAQYDVSKDQSKYDFFGDYKLLSFSAQTSF
ncbi:hypothetical protein [Roseateles oligotrophus]|uniref:Porin domain-containing protein n=1 Tax=Roseateles oligotrophus TaxID=1769250 RepID=A0ABT2YK74_9BURK|nr:hypothetical protein [Roseateles oligotrophus]MCV2370462.1 hypothetical protein [Roseateles oligotrophus]